MIRSADRARLRAARRLPRGLAHGGAGVRAYRPRHDRARQARRHRPPRRPRRPARSPTSSPPAGSSRTKLCSVRGRVPAPGLSSVKAKPRVGHRFPHRGHGATEVRDRRRFRARSSPSTCSSRRPVAKVKRRPISPQDVVKVAVVARHGVNRNIGRGFVKGFGLKRGAIASSVGHDSHNICVVGVERFRHGSRGQPPDRVCRAASSSSRTARSSPNSPCRSLA